MATINLKAEKRTVTGRKVKNLRKAGVLPGNVYGKGETSVNLQVNAKEFGKVYEEAGETGLVELSIDSDKKHVLISNLQMNPVTDEAIHVDFREVSLKEKVTAMVPVEVEGESPVEKEGTGSMVLQLSEIEVEALPLNLPEKFVVNVEGLVAVDQAIYVKDLSYDKDKVEVKTDLEAIVAKVEPPQKEEVVEVAPAEGEEGTEAEAPAEGGEATEGEEKPAEGGEAPATDAPAEKTE